MERPTSVSRDKIIVRASIIGIVVNLLLAAFKAAVGFISGSIAIVLDAVNNTSDAASSLITIIGTKLASKQPDRKHPYGHGRVEYLSAMIISAIVLYAGITSLIESIKKIITPTEPDYKVASIVIVSVAIVVKLLLGTFVKRTGDKVNSDSLVNSGKDALLDSIQFFQAELIDLCLFKLDNDIFAERINYLIRKRPQIALDRRKLRRLREKENSTRLTEYITDFLQLCICRMLRSVFPIHITRYIDANSLCSLIRRHIIEFTGPANDFTIYAAQCFSQQAHLLLSESFFFMA